MKSMTSKLAVAITLGAVCTVTTTLAACWAHTHHLYFNDDPSTAVICIDGVIQASDCTKVVYSPSENDTVECYDDGNLDTGMRCDPGTKTIKKTVSTGTATCSGCINFVAGNEENFDI